MSMSMESLFILTFLPTTFLVNGSDKKSLHTCGGKYDLIGLLKLALSAYIYVLILNTIQELTNLGPVYASHLL